MICPSCQITNDTGAIYCKACRTMLNQKKNNTSLNNEKFCPEGHPLDPDTLECHHCNANENWQNEKTMNENSKTLNENSRTMNENSRTMNENSKTMNENSKTMNENSRTIYESEHKNGATNNIRRSTIMLKSKKKTKVIQTSQPSDDVITIEQRKLGGFLVTFSDNPAGEYFEIREGRHTIGTSNACDICITFDNGISDEHALLLFRRNKMFFRDNMSTNGSFVNGEEVFQDIEVFHNDEITIGNTLLKLIII